MASQGEWVPGVDMCCRNIEAMVQDIPMQDIPEQDKSLPQTNPEPEMGAAAAVVCDTSPSLLRNPPPIPAETAQPSTLDMILQALNGMKNEMKANTHKMEGMKEEIKKKTWMRTQKHCGVRCGKWANACRRAKWRRHVLRRASWGGVQRLSGPRWRRVRTG